MFAVAQEKKGGNVITGAGDAAKMVLAKQKLFAGEYVSALNSYKEIEKSNPSNASIKYYIGLCYFNLNQPANAKESLLKAESLPNPEPETHLVLGKIYQLEEKFDEAISEFGLFQAAGSQDKEASDEAATLLSQCRNAKMMMSQPVDVEVSNLGASINSPYDDKNPCITADGSKLIFTTRRPETTNDATDIEGDGKYFENIYVTALDSATHEFGKAANVGAPVNTKGHDACTSISPDGTQIFIYKNNASEKAARGGNIFVSKINKGKWRVPEPLGKPVNTTYWEGGACVDPTGKKYFFTSERPGGFGNSDIWMVEKISKTEWGEPVNLGSKINTPYDEAGMFLAPDGKTLFFCSNGPSSMGSYDIFRTVYEDGAWSTPVNLGYPINSPSRDGQLTLSADARYAYIASTRTGGLGEADLYRVNLKDYALLEKDFRRNRSNGLSILRGTIREGFEGYGMPGVEVALKDDSGNLVSSTETNDNGEYFFTTRAGTYQLLVNMKGYQPVSEQVVIEGGENQPAIVEKGYLLKK
jgi:Tol biopolymer transport system component